MPALTRPAAIRASRRTSTPQTVAAPVKGWNTRDPFEQMDPLDAIILDNWYPDYQGLVTRKGTTSYATGMGAAPVQTLASLVTGATSKFIAACNGKIFDISSAGAVGAALATGFTSDIWQTEVFNNRIFLVNGHDTGQIYDGSTVAAQAFTGVTLSTLKGVRAIHSRLFFWTGVDPKFWYGPVNGIAGALASFDLSTVASYGGNLISVRSLSIDGGSGIQSYTCFFMSSGEMLMYTGTDPSSAGNWAKAGSYPLPAIVNIRGITEFGGDIYVITANDHQQVSQFLLALKAGATPPRTKISGAATDAYMAASTFDGWQAIYYPAGRRMIYNIPNADGTFSQHVCNTESGAWCRFISQNAYCFGLFGTSLYFGAANGVVMQADTGFADTTTPIVANAIQAWQTFGTPLTKRVAAVRPAVQSNGIATYSFGLGFDYQAAQISIPTASITAANVLIWGSGNWNSFVWGGDGVTDPRWSIAGGSGSAIGLGLSASSSTVQSTWMRTDLLIEPGSAL